MKKATRKALSMVLIMITMLTLFGQSAFATTQNIGQDFLDEMQKTEDYVLDAIEKTKAKAEKEKTKNNKSEEEFDEYLDHLIAKLLEKTEKKVDKLIEKADAEGVELGKEFIEVEICGRTVLVDPFYAH